MLGIALRACMPALRGKNIFPRREKLFPLLRSHRKGSLLFGWIGRRNDPSVRLIGQGRSIGWLVRPNLGLSKLVLCWQGICNQPSGYHMCWRD